ncbi:MAG: glutathione S-transferase [Rhodobacteraceae bacterium]|nr:glutathione S-transferase [Paracoccaceae bacterium]
MTLPIFYSFRRCPYAMRARLALASARVEVELREVVLRDKPPALIAASPKATVPVLVLEGAIIDESYEIMRWALGSSDPEGWLSLDDPALVAACDGDFKSALDRYKYSRENIEDAREDAAKFLRRLEGVLAHQTYLGGEKRGLADMAIITFVRQYANVDRLWFDEQNWPNLRNWLEKFLASARFAAIMRKYPKWQSGTSAVIFPEL